MDPIGNGADYSKARSVLSVEREDIGSENWTSSQASHRADGCEINRFLYIYNPPGI